MILILRVLVIAVYIPAILSVLSGMSPVPFLLFAGIGAYVAAFARVQQIIIGGLVAGSLFLVLYWVGVPSVGEVLKTDLSHSLIFVGHWLFVPLGLIRLRRLARVENNASQAVE